MIKLLSFFVGILIVNTLLANTKSDSLINKLNTVDDNTKLEIFIELANNFSTSDFDSALLFCNKAIELASNLKKPIIKANGLKTKGNIYFRKGELDKTLELYNEAIAIFLKNNDEIEAAKIYNNKSLLYIKWGDRLQAMQNLEEAFFIYNKSDDKLLTTGPLINMGLLYFRSGDYKNAELNFLKALQIAKNYNELEIASNATFNLGAVYNEWGKYADALEYYDLSIANFKELNDKYSEAVVYYNIGVVYEFLGNYSKAVDYVLKSLEIKNAINSTTKVPINLNKLGNIYTQWAKYELAFNYYADALSLATKNKDKLEIANALSGMAKVYTKTDIYNKSLDYYSEAIILYEELDSKKEIAKINSEVGNIYSEKFDNSKKAIIYFNNSEQIYKQINSETGLADIYYYKAKFFFKQNSFKKAIIYINKSIILTPYNSYNMLNNYLLLAQCYSQLNEYKNATYAYKQALIYKDSVAFDKNKIRLAQLEIQFQIQKKEQEIENLLQQTELNILLLTKNKKMLILLITLIILLLSIIVLALVFYKKLKAINNDLIQKQIKIESHKKELEETNNSLKEANIQAERLSKFKSQFLANISHEIRTPLNAISGYSNLLAKNLKLESNNYYINQVLQSTENMMIIISDLLDFSKIEAGKMVLESIKFNPVKIITQAISTLKFRAEEKNIKLEIHIEPLIPKTIVGDPHRLSQVLINLISNAIKYSSNGQIVTIEARCENSNNECLLSFDITDRGVGIAEKKLETIFETFTQITSDTSRLHEGTGLGLSIVKRLVELQNGKIDVKSKVKEGSVFSFSIKYPISKDENSEDKNRLFSENRVNIPQTHNILLVEDNVINQELAKDTITSWQEPFKVDIAENGKEAIMALQKKEYSVVLMDIQMPVMDGHEATQYIRSSLPFPKCNIPIIGMTAHALSSERDAALKNGMNEYLTKPFNPDELKQKILYFVSQKE